MSEESDKYEEFTADLIRNVQGVQRDIRDLKWGRTNVIKGASGQQHQVDVSFVDYSFAHPKLMLVECKRYTKPIDLEHVKVVLATALDILVLRQEEVDVGAIIVSTNGEREGARRFARHYGITLEVTAHSDLYTFRYENIVLAATLERVKLGDQPDATIMRTCPACNKPFEAENEQALCRTCG